MADLDNLKKTNEEHGHLMGEFAVSEIGRIIGSFHESGRRRAARFSGDEYLGVASYPEHVPTAVDLIRATDEALYRAKHAGGNIVVSE